MILSNCSKENITNPEVFIYDKGAQLLEKHSYEQNSTTPYHITRYDYNEDGVCETVTNSNGENSKIIDFEKYIYSDGELTKILLFENTGSGNFLLADSIVFVYTNNSLSEKIDYSFKNIKYTYEYSENQLIEEKIYYINNLLTSIQYKYSDENLINQIIYSPPYRGAKIINYIYEGALVTRKCYYDNESVLIRRIEYTYDRNGNLIMEDPTDLVPLSGGDIDSYYRYFYEQPG